MSSTESQNTVLAIIALLFAALVAGFIFYYMSLNTYSPCFSSFLKDYKRGFSSIISKNHKKHAALSFKNGIGIGFGRENGLHNYVILDNIQVGDSAFKSKNSSIIYFYRKGQALDTIDFRIFYRHCPELLERDTSFHPPKYLPPYGGPDNTSETSRNITKYLIPEALKYPPYDSIWKVPPEEWPERRR